MFRYYLLVGDSVAPSGLYARLCHAFLVFTVFFCIVFFIILVVLCHLICISKLTKTSLSRVNIM